MLYSHPRKGLIQWDRVTLRACLGMLILSTAACATQSASNPFVALGQPVGRADDVAVEVRNTGYYDVVVRVDRSGVGHKLGTIRSGEVRQLTVPRAIARASSFVLVANQIHGPEELLTVPLSPLMGQRITWELGDTRFAHRLSIR